MVIFITTRSGYEEMKSLIFSVQYSVWVGAGVLSQLEIDDIRLLGVELTHFTYSIDPENSDQIEAALNTISDHHPGQRVWLERILSIDE